MTPSRILLVVSGFLSAGTALAQEPGRLKELREAILKAGSYEDKAKAYQELFRNVGLIGCKDFMKDEDTGIALQAAWEAHKKLVKRPKPIDGRTEWVYDRAEMERFVAFLKGRTKAPVPDWWGETLVAVDVVPGEHHAFVGGPFPKVGGGKDLVYFREGHKAEKRGGKLVYTGGERMIEIPEKTFSDSSNDSFVGLLGEKRSFVAAYMPYAAFPAELAWLDSKGGKPVWMADVWAAGRDAFSGWGLHRIELRQGNSAVYVFGAESHGAYLEAFEEATGKCLFRFCTCYWFNFPEKWGLK
jgi:hypothetical protein